MKKVIEFPKDFKRAKHQLIDDAWHWQYKIDDQQIISITGGAHMYGDGFSTFEMWDRRNDDDGPIGYLTREEINRHLEDNPIETD